MPTPKTDKFSGPLEQVTVLCTSCEHRNEDGVTCKAFPKGIPIGVFTGDLDHTKAIPGDKGILYAKKKLSNAEILKANPNHDELGRFSTADGAKFMSIGGAFDSQRYNSTANRAAREWASAFNKPAPRLFNPNTAAPKPVSSLADLASAPKVHTVEAIANDIKELKKAGVQIYGEALNWHDAFQGKVLPRDIMNAMLGGLPKPGKVGDTATVTMRSSPHMNGKTHTVLFKASSVDLFGAECVDVERSIDTQRKKVDHTYLKLGSGDQGGGAVKKMFAEVVPLYQKMGLEKITTHANLDAGGYAWGRYGFSDDNPPDYHNKATKAYMIRHATASNLVGYTPEHAKENAAIRKVLEEYKNDKNLPSLLTTIQTPHLDAFDLKMHPKSKGFLKSALGPLNWYGHFDLKDKARLKHLGTYVGKKLD